MKLDKKSQCQKYLDYYKKPCHFFLVRGPKNADGQAWIFAAPYSPNLRVFFQRLLRFSLVSTPRAIIKRSSANPKFRRKILWKDLRAQHSWQAGVEGHFVLDLHWTPGEGELQKICRKTKMQTSIYRTVLTVSLFSKWLGKF